MSYLDTTREKFMYGNFWVTKHKFKFVGTTRLIGWTFKNPHSNKYETTSIQPNGFIEREFNTLKDAKEFVERSQI